MIHPDLFQQPKRAVPKGAARFGVSQGIVPFIKNC
jgi:hypothetical protein